MENILVAGANGTTGKKIVNILAQSQYFNPVAMVRKESQMEQFKAKNIEVILGDLEDDISNSTNNIDKVIFAAGSGGKKVVEVDQEGAKKLVDASKASNVKKFVMLSSMGADQPEKAEKLKDYLQAKHNADVHLKNSGLNFAIVRPGSLTDNKGIGKIVLSERLSQEGNISRDDVAQTLVRALHDDVANHKTFEILEGETLIGQALDTVE